MTDKIDECVADGGRGGENTLNLCECVCESSNDEVVC